jgi:hypothetical protein
MDETTVVLWDCLGVQADDLYKLRDMLHDSEGWRVFARLMEAHSDELTVAADRVPDDAVAHKTLGATGLIVAVKRLAADVQDGIAEMEQANSQE